VDSGGLFSIMTIFVRGGKGIGINTICVHWNLFSLISTWPFKVSTPELLKDNTNLDWLSEIWLSMHLSAFSFVKCTKIFSLSPFPDFVCTVQSAHSKLVYLKWKFAMKKIPEISDGNCWENLCYYLKSTITETGELHKNEQTIELHWFTISKLGPTQGNITYFHLGCLLYAPSWTPSPNCWYPGLKMKIIGLVADKLWKI
jgi:hypothetical protein